MIRGRKNIHDAPSENIQSPIKVNSDRESDSEENIPFNPSDEDDVHLSENDSSLNEEVEPPEFNKKPLESPNYLLDTIFRLSGATKMVLVSIVFVSIVIIFNHFQGVNPHIDSIDSLKEEFPKQDDKLWLVIDSCIEDIINLDKQSTITFIYKENNSNSMENLLNKIVSYASCRINNCNKPVILDSSHLNIPRYRKDYGHVIEDIRPKLEDKKVLAVKNVDEISPEVAQAFHSICDEYSPLVEKSLIVFTMKVNNDMINYDKHISNVLRNRWNEIDADKLEPLITRVSGITVKVTSEDL